MAFVVRITCLLDDNMTEKDFQVISANDLFRKIKRDNSKKKPTNNWRLGKLLKIFF